MSRDPIDYGALDAGRDCNYWALDRTLQRVAERAYPEADYDWAAERLDWLGEQTGTRIADNSEAVERHPPELDTYDDMGEVLNHVEYHPALADTELATYCEFGLAHDVFHAPEGRDEPLGLTHAIAGEAILSYADPGFVCPASMTVGAAIVLDRFGRDDPRTERYLDALTSDDPDEYVEGAMFLTEKQGGSDVGANETTAVATNEEGVYELTGEKWFCSNIDAEGTLALARREDAPEGTKGLSLFVVPHTLDDGGTPRGEGDDARLNDQLYRRLKDKLGTLSVPTGEVELRGATGYLVGEPERGFEYMTEMLNFERLSNAAASVGIMGRCLLESKVYAADREAFGQTIDQYPLMRRDLVEMSVDYEAATAFVFAASRLLDDYREAVLAADTVEEAHQSEAFRLMRMLVPVAKLRTARESVETASYACEVLGGNGYVSGFTTERMLRDAQVLPIWEGTSNILSLDLLRVLAKQASHEVFVPAVEERLDAAADHPELADTVETVRAELTDLQTAMGTLATEDRDYAQLQAKELANYVYDVFSAAELLAMAAEDLEAGDGRRALVAREFVRQQFGREEGRGIASGDRLPLDHFDAVVRYAVVDPADLSTAETAPADD
ncbi:acyl-CoA dehydrogenase family protein [Halomarina salina]|uniref:Acyl-CoA dehydrogenase family protein n=1 Tax=Halomarina salina TaxID=1872699 RepID=A0ABD5RI24_9EURY|nr:acyl-CoA dehydrogenase family protein [Halomarina salina]